MFNAYLNYLQRDRAADYHADRTGRLRRFCEFAVERDGRRKKIGKLPALGVRIEDLIGYQEHLRSDGRIRKASKSQQSARSAGKGLQPRTVKGYVKAVLTAFNWASESNEGPLPRDFMPFRGFRHVRVPLLIPTEDSLIADDEHCRLLEWADTDTDPIRDAKTGRLRSREPGERRTGADNPKIGFGDMLRVYHATGARTGELAKVRVENFHRRQRQLVLAEHKQQSIADVGRPRVIALVGDALEIVSSLCEGRKPSDPIFLQPHGVAWTKDALNDRFEIVRGLAGVRDAITIYSYRHLWISEMLMEVGDIAAVARMAGTGVDQIEKAYGHFRTEHFAAMQEELERARRRRQKIS